MKILLWLALFLSSTAVALSEEPDRAFEEAVACLSSSPLAHCLAMLDPAVRNREARLGSHQLHLVQQALNAKGFSVGAADGLMGQRTRDAISQYQQSEDAQGTGSLTITQALQLIASVQTQANVPTRGPASAPGAAIRASRIFGGPDDYPPSDFAAYGIVAFKSRATPHDRDRHLLICQAYVASIRSSRELDLPINAQMVTVWPIATGELASEMQARPEHDICQDAVDHYGSISAEIALREAAMAGVDVSGLGPYMLAWSPATEKGEGDAIVLTADLSEVNDYAAALAVMLAWVRDIESDPSMWSEGWAIDRLRLATQRWFDRKGSQLLQVVIGPSR